MENSLVVLHQNIQTGNHVYCWSRKQTRKRRRISGFCRSIIFFWHKKC